MQLKEQVAEQQQQLKAMVTTEADLRTDMTRLSAALASAQLSHDTALAAAKAEAVSAVATAAEEAYARGEAAGSGSAAAEGQQALQAAQVTSKVLSVTHGSKRVVCHRPCDWLVAFAQWQTQPRHVARRPTPRLWRQSCGVHLRSTTQSCAQSRRTLRSF